MNLNRGSGQTPDHVKVKLTRGQTFVVLLASAPMAAVGVAGAVATFVNMDRVLHSGASALGVVAAGEGATFICALVSLALTLMGQHTPTVVRVGLWVLPLIASVTGVVLAPEANLAVVMAVTPMAMTAAGEGISLVARRVVAYRTGVDIEQQRRSGLMLWHANRAVNGSAIGQKLSQVAVWRLTKAFASTDSQMSVQLGEVQRYRIGEGADANLARVLSGGGNTVKAAQRPSEVPAAPEAPQLPAAPAQAVQQAPVAALAATSDDDGFDFIKGVLAEAEQNVATDATVKLLNVADVAALKGVKTGTVRSWAHRGKLPVHDRDEDGRTLFHPNDVAKLD